MWKLECIGTYYAEILSFENQKIAYIPRGFAHGYLTLEDNTLVQWCVDNDFNDEVARCLRYDDQDIHSENGEKGIHWPKRLEGVRHRKFFI